jgi:hypothetical protein
MMGWARARTGDFASGLIGLALVLVAGAVAAAVLKYATPRGARVAVAGAK